MKTNKTPKQYTRLHNFFKILLRKYLKKTFHLEIDFKNNFTSPYVLLGNHINNYDPILIGAFSKDTINFIASDEYFRNRYLRLLLNLLGAIPKTKFLSDMSTVKKAIKVIKSKGVIGLFPEGTRSWDGHTLPLIYSTAKMIKLLKTDVVIALTRGAMFNQPRWAIKKRSGKTYITYEKILTKKEVKEMDVNRIYEIISKKLMHDEYSFQKEHMNLYKGKNIAVKIEYFLYVCPKCNSFHTITSKNDVVKCNNCQYSLMYNEYGFFEGPEVIFDNTRDWNTYQLKKTDALTKSTFSFKGTRVFLQIGKKGKYKLEKIGFGTFSIDNAQINFKTSNNKIYTFPYDIISGINIQYNRKLEYYSNTKLYRFNFAKSNLSAYSIKNIISGCKTALEGELNE